MVASQQDPFDAVEPKLGNELAQKVLCPPVGPVAQGLERAAHNRLVVGSIPTGPTNILSWSLLSLRRRAHNWTRSNDVPTFPIHTGWVFFLRLDTRSYLYA